MKSKIIDIGGALVLALFMAFSIAGLLAALTSGQRESRRDAFFSECIEHHLESRCKEFWRYNRTDLGRKP